jgi:hypothetical protein
VLAVLISSVVISLDAVAMFTCLSIRAAIPTPDPPPVTEILFPEFTFKNSSASDVQEAELNQSLSQKWSVLEMK